MVNCDICRNLDHQRIEYYWKMIWPEGEEDWNVDRDLVKQSSLDGCPTCSLLDESLSALDKDWGATEEDSNLYLDLAIRNEPGEVISIQVFRTNKTGTGISAEYELFPQGSNPDICGDTGSVHARDIAVSWLRKCLSSHQSCSQPAIDFYPQRLIDISPRESDRDPVLVDTSSVDFQAVASDRAAKGKSIYYVALSHCWGKTALLRTLKENIKDFRKGIPWDKLSKTFQESIEFTNSIKLCYIWIDSLCIIQDSREDWAAHASLMASIYENALLTVSATASKDGTEGLFRRSKDYKTIALSTKSRQEHTPASVMCFRKAIKHPNHLASSLTEEFTSHAPLVGRGWCYQEYLLSPRTIQFTEAELVLECQQEVICECMRITPELADIKTSLGNVYSEGNFADLHWKWREIVQAYSYRKLSFGSDKLPALSGIAKQMQSYLNVLETETYLAGLWQSTLLDDLCWHVTGGTRPLEYRAPSWSWASVDGDLKYDDTIIAHDEKAATVLDVQCTPLDDDVTCAISSGYVVLEAPLLEVKLFYQNPPVSHLEDMFYYITNSLGQLEHKESDLYVYHDYVFAEDGPKKISDGSKLYSVRLGSVTAGGVTSSEHKALILVKEFDTTYKRIGYAESDRVYPGSGWFENIPPERITII